MSVIRRFAWSRENIRHTGITLAFVGLPVPTSVIIVEYVSYYSVLNHFNLVNILSAKGPHIQLGDGFCIHFVPFHLSSVGTGRPAKTFHVPMTSLKVSIINFMS